MAINRRQFALASAAALQRGNASASGPAVQQVLAASPKAFELAGLPLSLKRQGPQYHNMSVTGPSGQLLF